MQEHPQHTRERETHMAEMTQDEYAHSIDMKPAAFAELLDGLQRRTHVNIIRRWLREQYNHRVSHEQLAAAKQWYKDHPQD